MVGWVLSGPVDQSQMSVHLTFATTHSLRIDAYPTEQSLDDSLKRFWDVECLRITKKELLVYETFVQQISFNGER